MSADGAIAVLTKSAGNVRIFAASEQAIVVADLDLRDAAPRARSPPVLVPGLIGFALGALFLERAHDPLLQHVLSCVSAAAAGMLIATGLRLMRPHHPSSIAFLM